MCRDFIVSMWKRGEVRKIKRQKILDIPINNKCEESDVVMKITAVHKETNTYYVYCIVRSVDR